MSYHAALQHVAIAGLGGFASHHHAALEELEHELPVRVTGTCDPREAVLDALKQRFHFAQRQTAVFRDFHAMLKARRYDWVSIATPIGLHAEMHAACIERGLPCYLEKPPTLDPSELERMIEVDSHSARSSQVGFNFVYEPERLALKERILAGEFGALRQISVLGSWRRNQAYYRRNSWSGRLFWNGTLLLDSCLGNAMAHHVHNVLFFAGADRFDSWGGCKRIEAQLFRANPIEGADTVFLRGELESSIEVRLALTHAGEADNLTEERLVCDKAIIRIVPKREILIEHEAGGTEAIPLRARNNLKYNLKFFSEYIEGTPHRLLSTLPHCRPFVQLNAMAYLSSEKICQIDSRFADFNALDDSWRVRGMEPKLESFIETGDFSIPASIGAITARPIEIRTVDWDAFPACVKGIAGHGG